MSVRELDAVAALAPVETELAMMTAVHRIAARELGLTRAVEGLAPLDRVHAIAICTVVILLEAFGRTAALDRAIVNTCGPVGFEDAARSHRTVTRLPYGSRNRPVTSARDAAEPRCRWA
jgi:hypothetical protein